MQILAATDFSDRAVRALHRAGQIAASLSAKLILAHVVEAGQPEHFVAAIEGLAANELEAAAALIARSYGVTSEFRVVRSYAVDGIAGLAQECFADLIVMGTHRKTLLKDVVVGTTVERVVRARVAPVLIANADQQPRYRSVLVAIDFSECSAQALLAAGRLGLLAGARVTIIHISNPSDVMETSTPADEAAAIVPAGTLKSSQALTAFLSGLELDDVEYSVRVRPYEGPPGEAIKDVADELGADLVVVGTQGRNRALRTLLGSVTDDLLKTLAIDILIIPCARAFP